MEPHPEQSESRQESRPVVIPYLGSTAWYSRWLHYRMQGHDDATACGMASGEMDPGKSLRRTLICGSSPKGRVSGAGELVLSVSVSKGPGFLLSAHGNWPHRHLGALEAIYGRTPFYPHIIGSLRDILRDTPESLPELNRRLHEAVTPWIDIEAADEALTNRAASDLGRKLGTFVNDSLSILDPIFRFGKDTTLLLACHDFPCENTQSDVAGILSDTGGVAVSDSLSCRLRPE